MAVYCDHSRLDQVDIHHKTYSEGIWTLETGEAKCLDCLNIFRVLRYRLILTGPWRIIYSHRCDHKIYEISNIQKKKGDHYLKEFNSLDNLNADISTFTGKPNNFRNIFGLTDEVFIREYQSAEAICVKCGYKFNIKRNLRKIMRSGVAVDEPISDWQIVSYREN